MTVIRQSHAGQSVAPFVEKGKIYTISRTFTKFFTGCLEFYKLPIPSNVPFNAWFPAKYFKPGTNKQADISKFKALLDPINHKQLEDA